MCEKLSQKSLRAIIFNYISTNFEQTVNHIEPSLAQRLSSNSTFNNTI